MTNEGRRLIVKERYRVRDLGEYSIVWGIDIPGKGFGEGFFISENGTRAEVARETLDEARKVLENRIGNKYQKPYMDAKGWLQDYRVSDSGGAKK
ncbi:MAG: hypothetical protein ABIF88_00310 [archaeon]